ncbi:hypothetical protein Cgig2_022844 [Carnegiea gigantea]|uniref:Polygalacturonase n=1 Tax=Carnegiea gigantea TaxID=171969 RepID=A0A9Q1KQ90_9CARY|nr:hypothetical protein Cgig2_022844 [Carnegiea gigantea]
MHGIHAYSRISMPPSPAPTANSPSYGHNPYDYPSPPPSASIGAEGVFDIRSFGAVGDGIIDDTSAFKAAWDAACQVENGKVLVARGHSFLVQPVIFTGPCKSGLVFQIEGTIVAPDGPESWPKGSSKRQWLIFYRSHGLTLQGGGLIDGKGDKWWNLTCKPHKHINGTKSSVRGMKLINSPQFHIRFDACQNVNVDSLVIKSPGNSPNTDGIHVENTIDARIYNSFISNGDDCVSIGAGTHNLDIKNVTCGPSHGISIGSLGAHNTRACVSNITVTNCLIRHSDNGVRIKTWQGGSGSVSGVTFEGIHMDTVRNPIIIDQYYCLSKNCSNQTSAVSINAISYTNIKGTYNPRGPPVHLACSDSVPCTNITLSGLELVPAAQDPGLGHKHGKKVMEPLCWNAYGSSMEESTPPVYCLLEGLPYQDIPPGDMWQC